ncbi:MAG: VWA domain-containing protein [Bacteroidota bacterium]|nr:VWA domain-containing protein [Bacteroidota bacterium]
MRIFLLGLIFLSSTLTFSQQKQKPLTRILIIFDASNSMYEKYEESTRIETAKKMFAQFADSLQLLTNTEFGLRIYGHQKKVPPQDCSDTKLEVLFYKGNLETIKNTIKNISPKGTTPIARSLIEAADDFPSSPSVNMIILITDGIEECGGDICDAAKKLKEKGIRFRPFVIGMGLSLEDAKTFNCVGPFYDIAKAGVFSEIIDVIITQTLYVTTAQVNLLDAMGKPTETNVNMSFYDYHTKSLMYNYVHTINSAGNPDTVKIDPAITYKIIVNTIPQIIKDSVVLFPGKHNIIGVDAPQGRLNIKIPSYGSANIKTTTIVRNSGDKNTLHLQEVNTSQRYLVGNYDLEILTLPRIYIKDVNISSNTTRTIEIPKAGTVKFNARETGYGSVFSEINGKMDWVYDLDENNQTEILQLQPGNYKVVFRPKSRKEAIYTVEKNFKITSDGSIAVNLY